MNDCEIIPLKYLKLERDREMINYKVCAKLTASE